MKPDDRPRVGEALARLIDRVDTDDLLFGCLPLLLIVGGFMLLMLSIVLAVLFFPPH